ncbi:MmgE/PrpD family protein [Mesorhizobium sangaii]|uniref:2-methylcitrate dehydratase PrpD n=1 Tax=Mesorhizobium sangaii TaxID=505389 RepID=A0A841PGZ1_9HYPH|nr:MmgE/PrpD family protein [Mesorhizobium sangaii]MBB6414416.1 2-methylcitrate dehydratase PrpD [Mesorhizobium sangaii]
MSLTRDVANMVANLTYDELPAHVCDKAKLLVLDHVGCMIAGSTTRGAHQMTPYLGRIDSGGPSTVFGTSLRFHPANAAHANAHGVSMLSLDDSYILFGHPGASIIPAALAVAEDVGSSGKELITAIVGGYEMSLRLGTAMRPSEDRDRQVKGYATWQIFGACTAASLLYRFTATQIVDAYGLTPMHAPLPFLRKFHSRPMSLLKNNYGWANKGAITAVDLVRAGFHGNRTIFDGDDGFWAMAGSDRFEPGDMLDRWGERYFILETGFKPFGVCRWIHTAVDCLRALLSRHRFSHADIKGIHVETVSEFVRDFNGPWPQSTVEAAFHIPYALALELHDKSSATGLREDDLADKDLQETASRISLSTLAGADEKFYAEKRLPARVSVTLENGETLSAEADVPTGAPGGPAFGPAQVEAKFLTLVKPVFGEANAVRLKESLLELESLSVRDALKSCAVA